MPTLPYEVDNRPMILAALNVVEVQIDKLFPTETTTEKHRWGTWVPIHASDLACWL
jgi:hypothetical protein